MPTRPRSASACARSRAFPGSTADRAERARRRDRDEYGNCGEDCVCLLERGVHRNVPLLRFGLPDKHPSAKHPRPPTQGVGVCYLGGQHNGGRFEALCARQAGAERLLPA